MALSKLGFGVEIEAVVEPWKVRPEWRLRPQEYYQRLALALENRGLSAVADRLDAQWQAQYPHHYDKWFITKDGSLEGEEGQVCLEAVSPILYTDSGTWEEELILFWKAMKVVFDVQKNFTCGSHIHVAPQYRSYTTEELRIVAFAIITQEHMVKSLLPQARSHNNTYCQRNSALSPKLKAYFQHGKNAAAFAQIKAAILQMTTPAQILDLMQGESRYVIWNFRNVCTSTKTIEFRGGRHLRGPNRTFWWITFAVSFVSLALKENTLRKSTVPLYVVAAATDAYRAKMRSFWENLKSEADRLQLGGKLPGDWHRMKEIPQT